MNEKVNEKVNVKHQKLTEKLPENVTDNCLNLLTSWNNTPAFRSAAVTWKITL